jgi:hypothetical protein
MTQDLDWLDDIALIAEGASETAAVGATIFRSEGEACRYLEPWWVEQAEGFAFSASGQRLMLRVDGARVVVAERVPCENGHAIVLNWLLTSAKSVLDARTHKASKRRALLSPMEQSGELPRSVEGLIAYIGFHD